MELNRMLKALGEPMRLKIYQALLERKHCVRSLSKKKNPQGFKASAAIAKQGGAIAGNTRKQIEKEKSQPREKHGLDILQLKDISRFNCLLNLMLLKAAEHLKLNKDLQL